MYSSLELADYRFKIIFTGDSVVGKTSLISSYADNHFQTNTLPTLGVDFKV
jgi:GTPase SAR1 family protein